MSLIKKMKPITNGSRHLSYAVLNVDKIRPDKSLTSKKNSAFGIGMYGNKCVNRRSGHKKLYRNIDFNFYGLNKNFKVLSLEYDPNRSANIAKVLYEDGVKKYIIAPKNLKRGDNILSSDSINTGTAMKLIDFPIGSFIYNIEIRPNSGSKMARSAGSYCVLLSHGDENNKYCQVKLPSGEIRLFSSECKANFGKVGNESHELIVIGKAGRNFHIGKRPSVRGVATSWGHVHSGGEGKGSIAGKASNKKGTAVLGQKTRNKRRSNKFIKRFRKEK